MAPQSDRSDWDSDTLHVKDVLPSFLDLSKFLPEMIDVKWLPPVPNLNIFQWVSWPFRYLSGSGSSALPELIIQPPTRVLPALSGEIDREESSHRFDYWFSFLVCGPPVMACLCEMIRLLSLAIKRHFAKPKEPRDYDYVQVSGVSIVGPPSFDSPSSSEDEVYVREDCLQSKALLGFAVACYHLFCVSVVVIALAGDWISIKGGGTLSWELWVVWQHTCLWVLFIQNLFRCYYADAQSLDQKCTVSTILLHTAPIASELTDTMKDWVITGICLTAQPSKMGMLWGLLFVLADIFPRTLCSPPDRFPFRIVGRMWMPLIVWQIVLAGFCLSIAPQWLILMGIMGTATYGYFVVEYCLCDNCGFHSIPVILVVVLPCFLCRMYYTMCTDHADETAHSLGKVLMDSGALFMLSFYVICSAYYFVASDKDGVREMRRPYFGILAWPIRSQTQKVGPVGVLEQVYLQMSNKAVDFLSTARLLIAWVEDWPQGLLGLLLAIGHRDQVGSFGFAAFSAIISFLKGILIPSGQLIIVSLKQAEVRKGLMDSKQLAMYFGENSSLTHDGILSQWQRALEERARDVLSNANILEGLDVYQPIYKDKDSWMMEMMEHVKPTSLKPILLKPTPGSKWLQLRNTHGKSASSFCAVVCGELVSQLHAPEQRRDGATLDEILRVFPPEVCQLAGFADEDIKKLGKKIREAGWSLEECIKAGYTVEMCLEAGYAKNDFEKIGFNRLHLVSGFKEEDLASIGVFRNGTTCRELKEAGFSLKQCGEAGYTVKMCLEARYTKNDFKTGLKFLRLTQEDLVYIGVALDETGCRKLKEDGFSLEQCGKAGYTVKMCLEAGYTMDNSKTGLEFLPHFSSLTQEDLVYIGVALDETGCRKLKEAGLSLEQCGKAGYTVKMCLEAGYTKNHFEIGFKNLASIAVFMNVTGCRELKEAGFSLEQCGKAGYTVKMCLEAGYKMDDFDQIGFKDLASIAAFMNVTGCRELKEAGFSLEQCGKVGYTVKMCLEAGYTKNDFDQIGFNRLHVVSGFNEEDLASIGVSRNVTGCGDLAWFILEQCGKAGYTVKMCLKAGYSWFEGLGLGRDTSLDLESNSVWQ